MVECVYVGSWDITGSKVSRIPCWSNRGRPACRVSVSSGMLGISNAETDKYLTQRQSTFTSIEQFMNNLFLEHQKHWNRARSRIRRTKIESKMKMVIIRRRREKKGRHIHAVLWCVVYCRACIRIVLRARKMSVWEMLRMWRSSEGACVCAREYVPMWCVRVLFEWKWKTKNNHEKYKQQLQHVFIWHVIMKIMVLH